MADFLTNEEVGKIRAAAKPTSNLPVVYENNSNPNKPISRTYEAHLILIESKAKRDALKWIDKAIEVLREVDQDRDDLFSEFHGNLQSDNDQQLSELDAELRGFEGFRTGFTNTKLNPVEVGWLFEDIASAMRKLQEKRSVQDHKKAILAVMQAKFEGNI